MTSIKKTYQFDSCKVVVIYEDKMLQFPDTENLAILIGEDNNRLHTLYDTVQEEYSALFGVPLDVSRQSFVVEIWGHLFIEKFIRMGKRFRRFRFFDKLCEQVLQHTKVIDCGEAPKDSNRKIWDRLAKLYDPTSKKKTGKKE